MVLKMQNLLRCGLCGYCADSKWFKHYYHKNKKYFKICQACFLAIECLKGTEIRKKERKI